MDKKLLRFILYCITVALLLTGIVLVAVLPNTDDPKPINNADAVYQEAVNRLSGQQNLKLNITYDKSTSINGNIFRERSAQTVTYQGLGTEQMRGNAEETLQIGEYTIRISELYTDGTGYFTVNDTPFQGSITESEYLARYIPAAAISPELYAGIQGTYTKMGSVIWFSQAATAESWCWEDSMENLTAEGTAYLDANGDLTKTVYLLSYTLGHANITLTATVSIDQAEDIQIPQDTTGYTKIGDLDAPRILETACGYLLSTDTVTASYADKISCEAFGDVREQTIQVRTTGGGSWTAGVDTKVTVENSSKTGTSSVTTKNEAFENGIYTAKIDGGEPTTADQIGAADMRQYCRDILVATIMLPEYITDVKCTDTEAGYRIEFTASESFTQMLAAEACAILYQKEDVLTGISQSYRTDSVSCYLTIDKRSGFPVASGFSYSGTYTISDLPYNLQYKADQTYALLTGE